MRALLIILVFLSSFSCVQAQKTPIRLIAKYSNSYNQQGIYTGTDSTYWSYSGSRGKTDEMNNAFDIRTMNLWDTLGKHYISINTSTFDANDIILSTIREDYRNNALLLRYKTLFTYDTKYNKTETTYYEWKSNSWQTTIRVLNSFDALSRMTQITNQTASGTQWISDKRTSFTYFNNTKKVTSETREQNSIIGLRNREQYLYSYDANENKILESYYQFDTSSWKQQYYINYGYDGNNRNIWTSRYPVSTHFNSRDSSSTLYDGNGNLITAIGFVFNSNLIWSNFAKKEITYDANNNVLTELDFSADSSGWLQKNMMKHQYNTYKLDSQSIYFAFKNGVWDTINKWDMTYDNHANMLKKTTTSWVNNQLHTVFYMERTYNQFDLVTTLKNSSLILGNYLNDYECTFIYDTNQYPLSINEVKLKNISTYPNPFSSSFSINYESNIGSDVSMLLYDSKGAIITKTYSTANVGENTITWDCGKTLPTGLYTYELHIGNETHSGKVLAK